MKKFICLLSALASTAIASVSQTLPPTEGKFFYADLRSNGVGFDEDTQYLNIYNDEQAYSLKISTEEYSIGLVAEECRNCHVPNRYVPSHEAQFLR
jgi:hypothetical protein